MKTLFAIPVTRGILDSHFGHSKAFALLTVKDDKIIKNETAMAPPHEPGKLPVWLKEQGVNKVIVGGIGHKAVEIFERNDIEVISGAPCERATMVVEMFLNGLLKTGENTCDH